MQRLPPLSAMPLKKRPVVLTASQLGALLGSPSGEPVDAAAASLKEAPSAATPGRLSPGAAATEFTPSGEVVLGDTSDEDDGDEAGTPRPAPLPPVDVHTVTSLELEGDWVVTSNGDTEVGTTRVSFNDQLTSGTIWFCDGATRAHLRFRMVVDPDPLVTDAGIRPLVILDRDFNNTKKFWRVQRWGEDGFAWKATVMPTKDEHLGWIRECPSDDLDFVAGVLVWTKTMPKGALRLGPDGQVVVPKPPRKKWKKRSAFYPPKWKRGNNPATAKAAWAGGKER